MRTEPISQHSGLALVALAASALLVPGCAQRGADPARGQLPAARSLGFAPASQAAPVGIDLEAAARLDGAGFTPDLALLAQDARWFSELQAVPLGGRTPAHEEEAEEAPAQMWRDMGFLPEGGGAYRRAADLIDPLPTLVPTELPELAHIDCLATISIDRHNGAEPYLYQTLRSLFAAFPAGVHINVLVSNTDVDYVSSQRLADAVGGQHVGHIHVHPTGAQTAAYLHNELPAYRRGGWNYARALRSYSGDKGLVLMEDDVLWTRGGPEKFDAWLQQQMLPSASLFNDHCAHLSGESDYQNADFRINTVLGHQHYFVNLQGMYYDHAIANSLGRYLQLRMHRQIYDHVIGWFFSDHKVAIGYAFPSITQHIGGLSAAKGQGHDWSFHQSSCFRDSF